MTTSGRRHHVNGLSLVPFSRTSQECFEATSSDFIQMFSWTHKCTAWHVVFSVTGTLQNMFLVWKWLSKVGVTCSCEHSISGTLRGNVAKFGKNVYSDLKNWLMRFRKSKVKDQGHSGLTNHEFILVSWTLNDKMSVVKGHGDLIWVWEKNMCRNCITAM